VPLALVSGGAALLVPGVVLLGFAIAGNLQVGIAPAAIVSLTLWLAHRKMVALGSEAAAARRACSEVAARGAARRNELEELQRRAGGQARELRLAQEATAFALMKLVEARDPSTGVHLERVRAYAKLLATSLAQSPRWHVLQDAAVVDAIHTAAPLHDIGKVGIADMILLKPARLTAEETTLMRRHATMGGQLLRAIGRRGGANPYLETAYEVAMYHHERWDGTGYPFGISGPHIPIAARIVALADVYDALTSRRCYKPAYSHADARGYIVAQAGRHFDPDVVEAFLARELDFVRIRAALTGDMPMQSEDLPAMVHQPQFRGAA
jgi:putative two-component system response regulator